MYFVPFEVETYVPITQTTIMSSAWEKWTISSKSEIARLSTLLNRGEDDKFDRNRVRGLVLINKQTYFIDSNGVALMRKASVRIDRDQFGSFRDLLRANE